MREIAIVQHVDVEGPGVIGEALRARGCAVRTIRIDAGQPVPSSSDGLAGLVVMGGPMGVGDVSRLAHLRDELRLIELALRAELPVLGVCLGSQLLASVLGARVWSAGRMEIGWHEVALSAAAFQDALFAAAPRRFEAFHWHGDVFDVPSGAVSLAASALTACQAFRWGERAYGLLFHLEVDAPAVRRMVAAFRRDLTGAGVETAALLHDLDRRVAWLHAIAGPVFGLWAGLGSG